MTRTARARAVLVAFFMGATLLSGSVHADERANAEILFRDGRAAMDAHEYEKACELFTQSLKAEDTIGTLLNLALCNEQRGKIATAWGQFSAVAQRALAMTPRQDSRAEFAQGHAAALEKRLSRVHITAPKIELPSLAVQIDEANEARELWERGIPVDPGAHTIAATADGKKKWSSVVTINGDGVVVDATIPALEDLPIALAPPPPPHGHRTAGFVMAGVGVVALGAMSVFGVLAANKTNDANHLCNPCNALPGGGDNPAYTEAVSAHSTAQTYANIANVSAAVGVLSLGVGAYFIFTSNSGKKAAFRLGPSFGVGGSGMSIVGDF